MRSNKTQQDNVVRIKRRENCKIKQNTYKSPSKESVTEKLAAPVSQVTSLSKISIELKNNIRRLYIKERHPNQGFGIRLKVVGFI